MKYKVISSEDKAWLSDCIEKLISEGWVPYGGVSIAMALDPDGEHILEFAQALILPAQNMVTTTTATTVTP